MKAVHVTCYIIGRLGHGVMGPAWTSLKHAGGCGGCGVGQGWQDIASGGIEEAHWLPFNRAFHSSQSPPA